MKKDYDELETYNHNNDSYNEYGGQARMTYDDLNRVVSAKVCGSMLWISCDRDYGLYGVYRAGIR